MTPTRRTAAPFRAVLCPVDFSTHARTALQYAAAVAARANATLVVLYVNDPFLVSAAAAAYNERTLAKQSADELGRFIHRALGPSPRVRVRTAVALGSPAKEILKAVRRERADLLVVGSEGLSGAPRLFFGSTTAQVLARSTVPVLAIPPGKPAGPVASWPQPPIIAAIDLRREAATDVARAHRLADWFGAPLSLVHVVEPTRAPAWLRLNRAAHDRARITTARTRLTRLAQAKGTEAAGTPPAVHVFTGRAAEQIATCAADTGAGLVLVTLRGDHRLFGDRQGTTTYQVVCQAATPVLAVPSGWQAPAAR